MTLPRPPYDPELGAFLEAQYAASPEPAAALSSRTLAGGFHGFQMAGETRAARAALAAIDSWLARLLAG